MRELVGYGLLAYAGFEAFKLWRVPASLPYQYQPRYSTPVMTTSAPKIAPTIIREVTNVSDMIKPAPAPSPSQTAPVTSTPRKWVTPSNGKEYEPIFERESARYGLPAGLLSRVAYQESRYIAFAHNRQSDAQGIMQIVPKWHPDVKNPKDPNEAIPYAAKYLAYLYRQFGRWSYALAAYNWGMGNLKNKALPYGKDWLKHLPTETYNYVTAICKDTGLPI